VSNVLPQGWEENKLSFLVDIIGGGTPKTYIEEYWNGDIPWLSVKDFNNDNRKVYKTEKTITELGLNKSSTRLLQKDELIISARGTVGELAQIPFPMAFNQSCYGLRGKKDKLDNTFLYYGLKNILSDIRNNTHGSVFSTITKQTFDTLSIKFPSDINEQKRIADILSAFDDKIELNNQMNQTLEDMATTLFKEWFENFNFPNEQGKPYKDNDGEMKSSVLGEIPVDWEVKYLKEISETISKGTTPKKNEVDGLDSNVYFLKVKDINNDGTIEFSSLEKIPMEVHQKQLKRSILKTDDILVSIAGTIGRTSIVPSSLDDSNCNQAIAFIRLKNKNVFKKFIYQWIRTLEVQNRIQSGIVQGVQANVSLTTLGDLKIILPNDLIMNKFNYLINPIFEQIQQNQQQNQTLKQQRDTLLPKLMSGEIRV
jgi:type I restriction enzyme, S subunit